MAEQDELVTDGGLTIHVHRTGQRFQLSLSGELDLENSTTLDHWLEQAEASDAAEIVLDLSQLAFIDSTGLKSILIAANRSQQDHNRLGVLRGTGQVARLLELTAIDQSLTLLD